MPTLHLTLYSLIASLLLTACSTPPYTDYDTTYDFTQARSFFITAPNKDNDPLMASRIQAAIDSELSRHGLQAADSAQQADLTVSYTLSTEDLPNNNRVSVGLGTGSYGGRGSVSVGGAVSRPIGGDTKRYTFIQIDMHPGTEERLIWRGRDSIALRGDPARRAEDAHQSVQRLLAAFPPTPTSRTDSP